LGTLLFCSILLAPKASAEITAIPESGWIPEYQQLFAFTGLELFKTNVNYDGGGALTDPQFGGQPSSLTETRFRLGAEYGIAQDWALRLKAGFTSASAESSAMSGSGSGLSDMEMGLKWNAKVMDPILTFEIFGRVPLADISAGANDIVITDGAVDVGVRLFTGYHAGKLQFSLAPGFVYRSKNYSPQFTLDGLVRYDFLKGYLQAIGNFTYSIDDSRIPFNTAPNSPDAVGAGGSFARLNGSPTGVNLGGGFGLKFYENWTLEGSVTHAIYGLRYPSALVVYVGVRNMFDFFKPIKPKRVREVPFEEDDSRS